MKQRAGEFVICVRNEGFRASLELRKLYQKLTHPSAAEHGQVRVVDESGEDYLFPEKYFVAVELPDSARRAISSVT